MNRFFLVLFTLAIFSCSDKPAPFNVPQKVQTDKAKRILILGNSIVRHPPRPEIGWNENCGMAASSVDSDFVHLLIADLQKVDTSIRVMYENIADFEADYANWDFHRADSFRTFRPDIMVMRISENVKAETAEQNRFIDYYNKLINDIDPNNEAVRIICEGWWPGHSVNDLLKTYATEQGYKFVPQSTLFSDSTIALHEYKHEGVQQHPNNAGMRQIKDAIWRAIEPHLKTQK